MVKVTQTELEGVLVLEPQIFRDSRGFFYESYNDRDYLNAGVTAQFVQDNHSGSARGVLRGLHYQVQSPQGKLIRVIAGEIFDVAVDLRKSSSSFGHWTAVVLSADNKRQLWVPEGFAHGFLVLSEFAEVLYKTTSYYAPTCERCILWNDPTLAIAWPQQTTPILSAKDQSGQSFHEAEVYP